MDDTTPGELTATALLRERHTEVKQMFEQLLDAEGGDRAELFDCLRATLAVHETVEEMFVHPMARSLGDDAERAVEDRLAEEASAKRVLADLEKMDSDGAEFVATLREFSAEVLAHAEAEEREVFPLIEQSCSFDEQAELADRIRRAEKIAPTHPHPHGPEGAVGNMVVGPFVAMVDKVRDALRGR